MKQNLILIISLLFSFSNFSQGITSIYSFKVENPNDVQTIVKAMTDHFQTDFAKAGSSSVDIVDEHFNGVEESNISFVYKFKDIQEMQDEYARVNSSEEIDIKVYLPDEQKTLDQVENITINTPQGSLPIKEFINKRPTNKIYSISR